MYHKSKLSNQEKIRAWLTLCDFSHKLLADNLGKKEMAKRLEKMRQEHLKIDYILLKRMSRIKQ